MTSTIFPISESRVRHASVVTVVLALHIALTAVFLQTSSQHPAVHPPLHLPVPLPMVVVELLPRPVPMGESLAGVITPTSATPVQPVKAIPGPAALQKPTEVIPNHVAKPTLTPSIAKSSAAPAVSKPAALPLPVSDAGTVAAASSLGHRGAAATGSDTNSNASDAVTSNASTYQSTHTATAASASNAPPGPISAPRFGAAYLNNPAPQYPSIAKRLGEQGQVLLRVFVSADGLAKEVKIHTSSGSKILDQSALAAVRHWRFIPAKQGDSAVAAWVQVPIVFKLD